MSETQQASAQTPIVAAPSAPPTTPRSAPSTRIYRIAAGMGIAVGGVVIAGAIFALGLLVGSHSGMDPDDGGYEADWDMGSFDHGGDEAWGGWVGPGDGLGDGPGSGGPAQVPTVGSPPPAR